jgi:hypothetical protein
MAEEMIGGTVQKNKISFWSTIFKQDVHKQANFVELMGWVGLIVLVVVMSVLWTVVIDITVPATEAKCVKLGSGELIIEAVVLKQYAFSVKENQQANIKFLTTHNEKIESLGEIIDIEQRQEAASSMIKVGPISGRAVFPKIPSQELKSIQLRIIVQKKKLIDLFFEKQDDALVSEVFE